MSYYVISINESMTSGQVLLNYLKSLSETSNYINIVDEIEEYPYNHEFVSEIIKSRKGKGITIKREDLWK